MLNNQNGVTFEFQTKTFTGKYPNVGQLQKIESIKLLLTDGNYGDLARSGHLKANRLLDIVDAFVYFGVMVPEMGLNLEKDFFDLSEVESLKLVKAYKDNIVPMNVQVQEEIEAFLKENNKAATEEDEK